MRFKKLFFHALWHAGWLLAGLLVPLQQSLGGLTALSQTPLFLPSTVDPNLMFAMSVEWPTAETAAYRDTIGSDPSGVCPGYATDASTAEIGNLNLGSASSNTGVCFYPSQTYVGYFDPNKCYAYSTSNHYFYPTGAAGQPGHNCSGKWSGNLLNWATMTSIDEFRWGLTGGTRDVDTASSGSTPGTTVLKRSVKYRGPNDYVFVVKRIAPSVTYVGSTAVNYTQSSGVTPTSNDVTLYFGNSGTNLYVWSTSSSVAGLSGDSSVAVPTPATASSSGQTQLYAIGGFQVRVQVCANGGSATPESNCSSYVNGTTTTLKPTGLIQNYSGGIRFGVASYLYDFNIEHNGGVLRSYMKYVGAQTKSPTTGTTSNPNAEWDANGVYVANPNPADASGNSLSCTGSPGCSGVINYINGFGYATGNYMKWDTVSELYYETLRYFAYPANGPTKSYVTAPWNGGLTASELDGYPAVVDWAHNDPVQYSCQNNVIVTIGDSNTWCDFNLPGAGLNNSGTCGNHNSYAYTPTSAGVTESINVQSFANAVGGYEGLGNLGQAYGNGIKLGAQDDSYFIAGLAWWAHANTINTVRPTFAGLSGSINQPFLTSYFIDVGEPGSWGWGGASGPNQYWLAAKYGGFTQSIQSAPFASPAAEGAALGLSSTQTTALWSADGGTTPRTYLYANQPTNLVNSLTTLFTNVEAVTGSQVSVASNSTSLQTGDHIFQAEANTGNWTGHLKAYDIGSSGAVSSTFIDAYDTLAAPDPTTRFIFSFDPSKGNAITFQYTSLSAADQTALGSADMVAYLRGSAAKEGTGSSNYRVRPSKLGDILNSAPVYVGSTQPNGGTRSQMVYVGANDGMLHAFSAGAPGDLTSTAGTTLMQEKFAYIPETVVPNLPLLAQLAYSHQSYVDASPSVVEAYVGTTPTTTLASGLGAGGRAVFALNVTNPDAITSETASNAASLLLWEFSSSQDSDLGYTYSNPQIVKTNALDASGHNRWAVIVGNGYNSTGTGQAALFILFLDHSASKGTTWVLGSDYIKLSTSLAGVSASAPNGMATPAVISSTNNGIASTVYAGDQLGNLWKFDISSSNTSNWGSALKSGATAIPLYTAIFYSTVGGTTVNQTQPITTAPEVVAFPKGGYMVLFGTGQLLSTADVGNTSMQTFYGIWDNGSNTPIPSRNVNASILKEQLIFNSTIDYTNAVTGVTAAYRGVSVNPVDYSTQMGWYLDLNLLGQYQPPNGERLIFNPSIIFGRIAFTTVLPTSTACAGGGTSWNMQLDPYNGNTVHRPLFDVSGDGLFGAADVVFNIPGYGSYTAWVSGYQGAGIQSPGVSLSIPTGCGTLDCHYQVQTSSTGSITEMRQNDGTSYQRLTWREITDG